MTDRCTHPSGEHNCIPGYRWWRRMWVCVRCDRYFRTEVR